MLVHLETALLFEVAHESAGLGFVERKPSGKHAPLSAVKPNLPSAKIWGQQEVMSANAEDKVYPCDKM
jgi:hypothetical protein